VNSNFLEMCVLEWRKLFADKKGKHFWGKIVSDAPTFEDRLLRHLELEIDAFEKEIKGMLLYRNKFIAHFGLDPSGLALPHGRPKAGRPQKGRLVLS
jgi:hypothetical protein